MDKKLSGNRYNLVLENEKLIYFVLKRKGIFCSQRYEDIVAAGRLGLVIAAIKFDSSKSKFSTYAVTGIERKVLKEYLKIKKHEKVISMDEPNGKGDNDITMEDMIACPTPTPDMEIEKNEDFIEMMSIILNFLRGRERMVILYKMGGMTQERIAEIQGVARQQIQTDQRLAIQKIRKIYDHWEGEKTRFSVMEFENSYRIVFFFPRVDKTRELLDNLLKKIKPTRELLDLKMSCDGKRIIFQVLAHPNSFFLIEQIAQEIDNFRMASTVDESAVIEDNAISGENKEIKRFILTRDQFSVQQILARFPSVSHDVIRRIILNAKKKGLIINIARGEYEVNRT